MGCGICRSLESVSHINARSSKRTILPLPPVQSKLFTVGEELSSLEESEHPGKYGKASNQSTDHAISPRKW